MRSIAFERFYNNQSANQSTDFSDNHFVIFGYPYHNFGACGNLGDEIQSIATKNALDSTYPNATYEYFNRDDFAYYKSTHKMGGGR